MKGFKHRHKDTQTNKYIFTNARTQIGRQVQPHTLVAKQIQILTQTKTDRKTDTHTHIHTHIHTDTNTHTYTHTHTQTHTHTHTYTHAYGQTDTRTLGVSYLQNYSHDRIAVSAEGCGKLHPPCSSYAQ